MSSRDRLTGLSLLTGLFCVLTLALGASIASAVYVPAANFGSPGTAASQFSSPSGVAVDQSTGDFYVADGGNARVQKFDSDGNFLLTWGWGVNDGSHVFETCIGGCQTGISGSAPDQFSDPLAVAVDNSTNLADPSAGDVYVVDYNNNVVDKFSSAGSLISQLTGTPTGPSNAIVPLVNPHGVAVDPNGNVWVVDASNNVSEFDSGGSFLSQFNDTYGGTNAIAVDSQSNVYLIRSSGVTEKWTAANRSAGNGQTVVDNSGTGAGLAIDPATDDLLVSEGTTVNFYNPAGTLVNSTFGTFGSVLGLAFNPTKAEPGAGAPGALYEVDSASNSGGIYALAAPRAPAIDGEAVVSVGATSAVIRGLIDPNWYATTYFFQYGTDTTYAGGTLPAPPGIPLPSARGGADQLVTLPLAALNKNTTYHYRVVAINANGPTFGPDQTFTTYPPIGQFTLPDHRGYELVSPTNKFNGDVLPDGSPNGPFLEQSATDGNSVDYESWTSFPGAQSSPVVSNYLAVRGPTGWTTQPISPPRGTEVSFTAPYQAFTPDLSTGILQSMDPPLDAGDPPGYNDLYLRNNSTGTYTGLNKVTPPNAGKSSLFGGGFTVTYAGASTDLSHVVFLANDSLTPGAPYPAAGGGNNVYEWVNGQLRLASVLPDGTPDLNATAGYATGTASSSQNFSHAVSDDGSRIFFTDLNATPNQLYVRENGTVTVKVSASQKSNGSGAGGRDPLGPGQAQFLTASADGSKVFFLSNEQLTNNATTGSTDVGHDLYEFDLGSGVLTDLTVDNNVTDVNGANVQGILGSSDDGSYIYFVALGRLAPGAVPGAANLYLLHGGVTRMVAPLNPAADGAAWATALMSRIGEVTPDGRHAAFMSVVPLTRFNNLDAASSQPDTEVFEYAADSGTLSCASCKPTNGQPLGSSSLPAWITPVLNPHYLSDDGSRLFFDSNDVLNPGDFNGKQDVYEYTGGKPYLISTGAILPGSDTADSYFVDASASGNDIFFTTRQQLVQQDVDAKNDLYDARVGGGTPIRPPVTPCTGDNCRPGLPAAPTFAPPASSTFVGSGNIPAPLSAPAKPAAKPKKKAKPKPKRKTAKKQSKAAKKAAAARRAKLAKQRAARAAAQARAKQRATASHSASGRTSR